MGLEILLASSKTRERMRRERLRRRLDAMADLALSPTDRCYLDLAEVLLLGEDVPTNSRQTASLPL